LHRVIDYKFSGLQRIDQLRISAQSLHGIAHGSEVDDRRYASEILQQHATWRKSNLFFRLRVFIPGSECSHLFLCDIASIFGAQKIFEQNTKREWQMPGRNTLFVEGIDTIDFVFFIAHFECRTSAKTVQ